MRRVLHARDATGREIGRVLWQKVVGASARAVSTTTRWRCRWCTRDGMLRGRDVRRSRRARVQQVTASADADRHRRRRAGVPRDDESGDRHRRRHRDGLRGRGARRRPRVRPVPSDRAQRRRARRGSCCRRRCAAKAPGWSTRPASGSSSATSRPAISASRDLVARAIVREVQRTGAPVYLHDGASRSALRAPPVPDDRAGVPARRDSTWPPIAFRSVRPRTT